MVKLFVSFTRNVTAIGVLQMKLGGGRSDFCYARLSGGNNTNTLQFDYLVSDRSGTAKLDCDSVYGLDASGGKLYRRSLQPILGAVLTLPTPGSVTSLGRCDGIGC